MSSNRTTFDGFDPKTYCLDLSLWPDNVCPGICIDGDLSGAPAFYTFLAATVVTGFGMLWLPHPVDRKNIYALSFAQSSARFVNISVLYFTRKANPYDLFLNVFMVFGAELTALIAFAPKLRVLRRKHFHWIKPFFVLLGCAIVTGIIAVGYRPDIFKEEIDKLEVFNKSHYGSQPACDFGSPTGLLSALLVLSIIVLFVVALSHMDWISELLHASVSWLPVQNSGLRWRWFWTFVILVVDIVWIAILVIFRKSYLDHDGGVINADAVNGITASQIFSIFLSSVGLLPPARHLFEQLEKWFTQAENAIDTVNGYEMYAKDIYQSVKNQDSDAV